MKKLLFGLMAIVLLAFNGNAQSGCSSDCLLGECRIKCDKSSTASCNCIIGLFSSCKCSEKVMIASLSESQRINSDRVLEFVKNKYDNELGETISITIEALKKSNSEEYNYNLDKLMPLLDKFPREVEEIKNFVESLK